MGKEYKSKEEVIESKKDDFSRKLDPDKIYAEK